jgi:WD40 repeat protein
LTASEDATAHVTDISRNDLLPLSDRAEYAERAAGISAAPLPGRLFPEGQFSPDGSRVVLADHHLARVVETETGQPIGSPVVSRWRYAHLAIFSPDGRRIATYAHDFPYRDGGSTWSTCQVRDAGTGRPVSPLLPHGNWLSVMAFRTDGEVLATGDYSGVVHRWDVKTGAMIGHPFAAGSSLPSPLAPTAGCWRPARPRQATRWCCGIWNREPAGRAAIRFASRTWLGTSPSVRMAPVWPPPPVITPSGSSRRSTRDPVSPFASMGVPGH